MLGNSFINIQPIQTGFAKNLDSMAPFSRMQTTVNPFAETSTTPSFKSMLVDVLNNASKVEAAPDELMQRAITVGDVDVHDVMIANAKADLLLNIATQSTTKIIQAYDRILQIQV